MVFSSGASSTPLIENLPFADPLFRANQRRIDGGHHRFDRDLVVQGLFLLLDALASSQSVTPCRS